MHFVDKNAVWKSNEPAAKVWIVDFCSSKIIGSFAAV